MFYSYIWQLKLSYSNFLLFIIEQFQGLENRKLPLEDEEDVIGAVTLILGCLPDTELRNNLLLKLLSPSFESISKLVRLLLIPLRKNI